MMRWEHLQPHKDMERLQTYGYNVAILYFLQLIPLQDIFHVILHFYLTYTYLNGYLLFYSKIIYNYNSLLAKIIIPMFFHF